MTSHEDALTSLFVLKMGDEQRDRSSGGNEALFNPGRAFRVFQVCLVRVAELVVFIPGLAAILAYGIFAPAIQIMVAGVCVKGHKAAVWILHADGAAMRVSTR